METPSWLGLAGMGRTVCRRLPAVLLPVVAALATTLLLSLRDGRQGYVATATLRLQPAGSSALVPYTPARPPSIEGLAATLSTFLATQGFALVLQERTGELLWPATEAGASAAAGPAGTPLAVWHSGLSGAAVQLEGRLVPRTALYRITVQHPDPARAVALAGATAELLASPPAEDPVATETRPGAAAGMAAGEPARLREELALIEARTTALRRQLQAFAALDGAALAGASAAPLVQELRALEESRRRVLAALAAPGAAPSQPDGAAGGIATVIDRATGARPVALERAAQLAPAAGLAGLLAGLALALGLHARDGRAHDAAEVAAALGLPVAGRVPAPHRPACSPAAGAPVPEAYRRLALRLAARTSPGGPADGAAAGATAGARAGSCLLFLDVSSPHPGAGTAAMAPAVAAHLAAALAQEGHHVLLVDGCLARPALPAPAGLASGPGLAERLAAAAAPAVAPEQAQPARAAGALQEDGAGAAPPAEPGGQPAPPAAAAGAPGSGTVLVMPAGRTETLAAGRRALHTGAAPAALAALAAGYDTVLIAGPAALETVDAALLARAAAATYLCVRLEETALADAVEARDLLAGAGGQVAGLVVMAAPPLLPPRPRRRPPSLPPPPAGAGPHVPPSSSHAAEAARRAGVDATGRAAPDAAAPDAPPLPGDARGRRRGRPPGAPEAPAPDAPRPPAGTAPPPAEVPAPASPQPAAGGPVTVPAGELAGRAPRRRTPAHQDSARARRRTAAWQQAVRAIEAGLQRLATPPPPPDQA